MKTIGLGNSLNKISDNVYVLEFIEFLDIYESIISVFQKRMMISWHISERKSQNGKKMMLKNPSMSEHLGVPISIGLRNT